MFGRKKVNKLIEDIDRYFDLMDQSVLIFKDGVRNFLYSHTDAFNENLMRMTAIESEASVLRREIENALYTQTALVRSRGDIMRLFEKTRNITDILNDSLFQFEIETPFIPSELNPEFMKLTEFSSLAVEAVIISKPLRQFRTRSAVHISTRRRRSNIPRPSRGQCSTTCLLSSSVKNSISDILLSTSRIWPKAQRTLRTSLP